MSNNAPECSIMIARSRSATQPAAICALMRTRPIPSAKLLANAAIAAISRPGLCQSRIPKDRKASAIRKRIGPALAIVDDESLDGHGLHCVRGDANSGMADAGCGAEQDHALLCGERRRRLRSTGITPASSLLRSSPPLTGASVLSASQLAPLAPFPFSIAV